MNDRSVMVTGASGFVGRHVVGRLAADGWRTRAVVRRASDAPPRAHDVREGIDLEDDPDWQSCLDGTDVVVHCAGVAHTAFSDPVVERDAFDRVNRHAAVALGRAVRAAGVRRFVFLSSVGVYGRVPIGTAARESMTCRPDAPYARSKLAAEHELAELFEGTATELIVLRPPLIYGERCPGNFARLVRLVDRGVPLPFGSLSGRRHFVALSNLTDLVAAACAHPDDAGGVFNVADADAVDLGDIVRSIGEGLGRPVRLVRFPRSLLRGALQLVGKGGVFERLDEAVAVDASRARERFGWEPRVRAIKGMRDAAASFASGGRT